MMRLIKSLTVFVFLFCFSPSFAQVSFYADTFKGGVTGGGYGPDYGSPFATTGTINVQITPGSNIRKAYLFAGRQGAAPPVAITFNGNVITFNGTNQVSPTFQSPSYGGGSAVHAVDVTSLVSASVTAYTLVVPSQNSKSNRFSEFYLFITYNNASLPFISTEFFLNDKDFATVGDYNFNLTAPVKSASDIGVGFFLGYQCFSFDTDTIRLNGTYLGYVYGTDGTSGLCAGPFANFYYSGNTLSALGDDNANQAMSGPDVLSNAKALIPDNSTSFNVKFLHKNDDNARWGFFIVSGGSCVPPVASAGPDTTFCYGNFVQLNAGGGTEYKWSPGTGLNDSTISSPVAFPSVTTTYTVTVSNSCSSATATAHITVNPAPPVPTILQAGTTLYCHADPSYISYQWFDNSVPIPGATDTLIVVTADGNYNVEVTNAGGCKTAVGINIILSTSAYQSSGIISLYPNPASKELFLESSRIAAGSVVSVSLINVLGQVLHTEKLTWSSNAGINIEPLSAGIYTVRIEQEGKAWNFKFIRK